ncbi:MAG: glycoside hydrolase, partial [bacterium]
MKYVVFHLHFYQPPRFNPFVNEIEFQDSAYPYDNWNERIMMECYLPNVYARIFDVSGYIVNIINNLEYVSFNFGPTLIKWIKDNNFELYSKILEADKNSFQRLGFGNAIAQVYNHIIMPLANDFDKDIQIYWGLRDFEYHFGRSSAGMWISETAVDIPTLEKLAENGIRFTILGPHQIKRYKKLDSSNWIENTGSLPNKPFI